MSSSPTFLDYMRRYWCHRLNLACTKALQYGWLQLEHAVLASSSEDRWHVVQLPTGAGKSSALAVLCASYSLMDKLPGTLIVTRFQKEADKLAALINGMRDKTIACSAHANSPATAEQMNQSPILCITHAAYVAALKEQAANGSSTRLDMYRHFHHGERKWLVIDEAFDFVDARRLELVELRLLAEHMRRHSALPVLAAVDELAGIANEIEDFQVRAPEDRFLPSSHVARLSRIDWQQFREAVRQTPAADFALLSEAESLPVSRKRRYVEIVDDLSALVRIGRGWVSKRGKRIAVHTSELLLPASFKAGVVLDATASVDPSYGLLQGQVELLNRPNGIRSYANVNLHVSNGHRLGKGHLTTSAAWEWKNLSRQLAREWKARRDILVIVHNDVEPVIKANPLPGANMHVAHWGDIDGKNDWGHCDAVVVFGLPYLDDITPTNAFLACSGQTSSSDNLFGSAALVEARWKYKQGFISKSIVQAINRARCRRVTSSSGRCDPCDVYLLLPGGELARGVERSVVDQMPGISIRSWQLQPNPKDARRNANLEALLEVLRLLPRGSYGRRQIMDRTGIKERTFQRISVALQDTRSDANRVLKELGVSYNCRIGGNAEACFTKV